MTAVAGSALASTRIVARCGGAEIPTSMSAHDAFGTAFRLVLKSSTARADAERIRARREVPAATRPLARA
jgi:hypothetical protein